jgi:hypothetical protein
MRGRVRRNRHDRWDNPGYIEPELRRAGARGSENKPRPASSPKRNNATSMPTPVSEQEGGCD